jgi:hypothetical protein
MPATTKGSTTLAISTTRPAVSSLGIEHMTCCPWPETPWCDLLARNHFEHDVTKLARDARDIGFDDLPELRLKLDGIVSACSELLALAQRHESARLDRIAREEIQTAIPPVMS